MAWVRVEVSFPRNPKVHPLSDAAFRLHVAALCWCAEHLTDGVVMEGDLHKIWLHTGRGRPTAHKLVGELVAAKLWEVLEVADAAIKQPRRQSNSSQDGSQIGSQIAVKKAVKWAIHDYTKYNDKKEQVLATRETNSARQRALRARGSAVRSTVSNAATEGVRNAVTNAVTNATTYHEHIHNITTTTSRPLDETRPEPGARPDVERLCEHLRQRIIENGAVRKPVVGARWREAARRMLDVDGLTEEQIHAAIDWCQGDEFWQGNIQSMSKLREQYDRLRLAAVRQRQRRPSTTDQRVMDTLRLAEELSQREGEE